MIITITSSETKLDIELPSYTDQQAYVRDKVDVGLLLDDKDYQIVIDDVREKFKVSSISEDSDAYEYVCEKYGRLNVDRLNRLSNAVLQ